MSLAHWSGKDCPAFLLPIFENSKMQVLESQVLSYEPSPTIHSVESPFAKINEIYDSEKVGAIRYEGSYNVNFGPLKGTGERLLSVILRVIGS
jgi:hypothetical protein